MLVLVLVLVLVSAVCTGGATLFVLVLLVFANAAWLGSFTSDPTADSGAK